MTSQASNHLATRIGRNILQAREAAGMTQRDVGVALDMSARGVSRWEMGKHQPSPKKLAALAGLFGQDIGWFYTNHDDDKVAA